MDPRPRRVQVQRSLSGESGDAVCRHGEGKLVADNIDVCKWGEVGVASGLVNVEGQEVRLGGNVYRYGIAAGLHVDKHNGKNTGIVVKERRDI